MMETVRDLLDLWDAYGLGAFPPDEYDMYVSPICNFLNNGNLTESQIAGYLYGLLPPVNQPDDDHERDTLMVGYKRVARILLRFLVQ